MKCNDALGMCRRRDPARRLGGSPFPAALSRQEHFQFSHILNLALSCFDCGWGIGLHSGSFSIDFPLCAEILHCFRSFFSFYLLIAFRFIRLPHLSLARLTFRVPFMRYSAIHTLFGVPALANTAVWCQRIPNGHSLSSRLLLLVKSPLRVKRHSPLLSRDVSKATS